MQFILYYGEDGDPVDTTYLRIFSSREAAVEQASLLQRYGYEIYLIASDSSDEFHGSQIREGAALSILH